MAFESSVWRRASVASSRKVKADTEEQRREESFLTFRHVFDRKRINPPLDPHHLPAPHPRVCEQLIERKDNVKKERDWSRTRREDSDQKKSSYLQISPLRSAAAAPGQPFDPCHPHMATHTHTLSLTCSLRRSAMRSHIWLPSIEVRAM